MILLDTSALLWIHQGHRRVRALMQRAGHLHVSPASLLELQLLAESGRLRLKAGATVLDVFNDERWVVDDPSATAWFEEAVGLSWTRDPFDRLLVAHARVRRWRLATSDTTILDHATDRDCLEI